MTREQRIAELEEAGVACSPEKVDQANAAGLCILGMILFIGLAFLFGERPVQKPAQAITSQVAAR